MHLNLNFLLICFCLCNSIPQFSTQSFQGVATQVSPSRTSVNIPRESEVANRPSSTSPERFILPTPSRAAKHQLLKQVRIEMVRKQVMKKLRLSQEFVVNASKEIPRVVFRKALEKLRMRDKEYEPTGMMADAYAQISEIVSFSQSDKSLPDNGVVFTLNEDVIDPLLQVYEAQVWVLLKYRKPRRTENKARTVTLQVRELTDNNELSETVSANTATVWHTRWQKIIIDPTLAQKLIEVENAKLRLVIECPNCDEEISPVLAKKLHPNGKKRRRIRLHKRRPFLILNTRIKPELLPPKPTHEIYKRAASNENVNIRKVFKTKHVMFKRSVQDATRCNYTVDNQYCRLVTFYVNLQEEFGDFVTHPSGAYMNYCAGNCGRNSGEKCCVATSKAPLELTYVRPGDEDGVSHKTVVDDLIITKCGCQ